MSTQPHEPGTVVVGADGSDRGYAGVRYAAHEAAWRGVSLDIVHVSPAYLPVGPLLVIPDGSLESFAAGVLERSAREAAAVGPRLTIGTHHLSGSRVEQLVRFAAHAELLVLAARHLSLLEHVWTGATVTGAVSRATCPTVVLPTTYEPCAPRDRIVVGYKSPLHAQELLGAAFALADRLVSELEVLHAWRLQGLYDDMVAGHAEEEETNARMLEQIEPLLVDLRRAHPRVDAYVRVVHRRPAGALVGASARADRLLLGKPAHGARVHHLSATARALLRAAQCPVEVVPPARGASEIAGFEVERGGELIP